METSALIGIPPPRPFIRIGDHHLIGVSRITEVDYVPDGVVYEVGDAIFFNEPTASQLSSHDKVVEKKTSILVIQYINQEGEPETIRRIGRMASGLWEVMATFLAIP